MTTSEMLPVDDSQEKVKRNNHIFRSTIMLMGLFLVSKGISLAQTFLIANAFGVGAELDAYVAAAKIPDTIVLLLGGGALNYAIVPILSGLFGKGDMDAAWRLASRVVNTFFMTALIASIFAFIFTPWLMANVIAPAYPLETMALSIDLMRILLIGTLIFSVSGIVMGMLQSRNHFLLPALAPILNDLGILFGVMVLLPYFGIYGLVYGAILGALLHLVIQLPGLVYFKAKWYPEFGFELNKVSFLGFFKNLIPDGENLAVWSDWLKNYLKRDFSAMGLKEDGVGRIIALMLPRLIGLAVFNFNMILMTNIASRLGVGGTSALDWGWRLMQIPETLIGSAMGIVILPTLSILSEVKDETGKRNAMTNALRFVLIATIPSSFGLLLVGRTGLSLLEGGAFDAGATDLVYGALAGFTFGLIVHSLLEIVARSFYADKDTLTPLWAAIGGAAINLTFAVTLSGILTIENPPLSNVTYLALSNSLGTAFEVIVLFLILRKRWHGINENSLLRTILKTTAASLAMGVAVFAVGQIFAQLGLEGRVIYTILQLTVEVAIGAVVFVGTALLLRMDEITEIFRMVFKRNKAEPESVQVL